MKQITVPSHYKIELVDVPQPTPKPNEVLVRTRRSLISPGSELRRYRKYPGYTPFKYPVREMGYTAVGEIVELGSEVKTFRVGQRVATIRPHAEFVTSPAFGHPTYITCAVPDSVSDEEAAFMPFTRSVQNWIRVAEIQIGETVVVIGQGLVGLMVMQIARLRSPARLIVTDLHPKRLALSKRLGADVAINAGEVEPVAEALRLTGGRGADCVLDTVGDVYVKSFEQAQRMARSGGRIVLVGMHTRPLRILPHAIDNKLVTGANRGYDFDLKIAQNGLKLIAEGRVKVKPLITHRFSFKDAADAYRLLDQHPQEALAVVLKW
jgi:2-desacetyl-2-hydroxyethyl bacteriochlorophyllide A dehydrogenase